MDDLDPYRPDATVEERADHVVGVLLCDEDPVRRYRTIQALQDGRLRDVAAISLRQLRDLHGTTDAAAEAVGISRQAANELLGKAGAPGARQDRAVRDKPTYWYGEYLACYADIAESIPHKAQREQAALRCYDLIAKASQTTQVMPALVEAAQRWLATIRRTHPALAAARARTLDEYGARISAWVIGRPDPHLTIAEQAEVWIGHSSARVRWRRERESD